jgi:hypothetical protein
LGPPLKILGLVYHDGKKTTTGERLPFSVRRDFNGNRGFIGTECVPLEIKTLFDCGKSHIDDSLFRGSRSLPDTNALLDGIEIFVGDPV